MELQRPMHVVSASVDVDVLTVLARAEHDFSIPTLRRLIEGRSTEGIRRALNRLVEQGIVHRRAIGRVHAFSLNRQHLAAPAIIELASLHDRLLERVRRALAGWAEPPLYAALFGSTARGEMHTGSDLDVLLVRDGAATDLWHAQVDALMAAITGWTGNDARALDVDAADILERTADDSVFEDIVRDGVPVYGDPTTLRRLVSAP